MVLANALASDVLPVPGTSSSSRWPPVSRQVRASSTVRRLPQHRDLDVATSASKVSGEPVGLFGGKGHVRARLLSILKGYGLPSGRGTGLTAIAQVRHRHGHGGAGEAEDRGTVPVEVCRCRRSGKSRSVTGALFLHWVV